MRSRAVSAASTGERILAAGRARLRVDPYDEITLDQLAKDAGVTVQTVLRRFGSKEGIVRAIAASVRPGVTAERDAAPIGDVAGAISMLVGHYEQTGDETLQLLRQELRVPVFAEITAFGRDFHRAWVARVFAPWLEQRRNADRARLHAQLVAACDVYTWFLLRRQAGLSRRATEQSMRELVQGVLS